MLALEMPIAKIRCDPQQRGWRAAFDAALLLARARWLEAKAQHLSKRLGDRLIDALGAFVGVALVPLFAEVFPQRFAVVLRCRSTSAT